MNALPTTNASHRHLLAAASIGVSAAFLLAGYECVRSASNTIYKAAYGKEGLPAIMAIMPVAVLAALYAYGWLLTRLGPRRTLWWTSLACAAMMAGATGVIQWDSTQAVAEGGARKIIMGGLARPASAMLYLLREAYIVLLIEQYWSFLNSTLGPRGARQLNGPICGLGSLGSVMGGLGAGYLVTTQMLDTVSLPFIAAASVLPAALASEWGYRACGEPARDAVTASPVAKSSAPHEPLGLTQFSRHRTLVFMLLVVLLTQVISTMLDLRFQHMLDEVIPDAHEQTAFSSRYFAWIAIVAGVLQFLAAPALLRLLPLTVVHVAIPCMHVIACGIAVASPSLVTVGAAYMLFKSIDYSVFRAAKEILYIPLPFDARYRAKEVIDVLGYRVGKGGTALMVEAARRIAAQAGAAIPAAAFAMTACAAAVVWAALSVPMARREERAPGIQGPRDQGKEG